MLPLGLIGLLEAKKSLKFDKFFFFIENVIKIYNVGSTQN